MNISISVLDIDWNKGSRALCLFTISRGGKERLGPEEFKPLRTESAV